MIYCDSNIEYENYDRDEQMKTKPKGKLAVFDTFKTKNQDLTGEAKRQSRSLQFLEIMQIQLNEQEQGFPKKLQKNKKLAGRISIQEFLGI